MCREWRFFVSGVELSFRERNHFYAHYHGPTGIANPWKRRLTQAQKPTPDLLR